MEKHKLLIWALCFLALFVKAEDANLPYEYIDVFAVSDGYSPVDENDHKYVGVGLVPKVNRFPAGSGECSKYIRGIDARRADASMQAFNYFVRNEGDYNDKPVRHVRLICLEYRGEIPGCREKISNKMEELLKNKEISAQDRARANLQIEMAVLERCRNENIIEKSPIFHHIGYENDPKNLTR